MPTHDEIKALVKVAFHHQQLTFTYAYGEKVDLLEMQKHLLPFYPEYFDESMHVAQCPKCKVLLKYGRNNTTCSVCDTDLPIPQWAKEHI